VTAATGTVFIRKFGYGADPSAQSFCATAPKSRLALTPGETLMSSNRRIEVKRIATSTPRTFLVVSVSYDDGKNSFMGYGDKPRGYYVSVSPVEVDAEETAPGVRFEKCVLGRGGKGMLETAGRFGQKRMNELVALARSPFNEALNQIVQRVLDRNGLTLPVEAELAVA
jgi:hypothetical protein